MPLVAYVYRNADPSFGDCSLNGWSSLYHQALVLNANGPCNPEDYLHIPHVYMVKHPTMNCVHIRHKAQHETGKHTMFGGNYLTSSDSRFSELIATLIGAEHRYGHGPVAIHDRIE